MAIKIKIPGELSDLIESCMDVWAGQHRPYGPYERVSLIALKKDYNEKEDKRRIVDFCQRQMHCPCRHEGWYALTPDGQDGKKVTYKWSHAYLD